MDTFLTDLRLGARSLFRTPMATSVALLSLALGIAVVTTLFGGGGHFIPGPNRLGFSPS